MAQTYKDFEIILVDDCSDASFQSLHPSISHHRNPKNLGPGESRNEGLKYAKGDYVVFMDSDDYWASTFLEKTVSVYNIQPELIMVYSDVYTVDEREQIIGEMKENTNRPNSFLPHILVHGRPWCTSSCLWNRNLIKDLRWTEQRTWEDYVFDVDAAIISNEIFPVKEHLVFYDTSGAEKLSYREGNVSLREKNESINIMAKKLKLTQLFQSNSIRAAISKLALNNNIAMIDHDINDKARYRSNMEIFRMYSSISFVMFIKLISILPKSKRLPFLRKLRNLYFSELKGL